MISVFLMLGTTMTQELVYLIQTLDFDTASKVHIDERFPIIEVKDDRYPYYKGNKHVMSACNKAKHNETKQDILSESKGIFFSRLPSLLI